MSYDTATVAINTLLAQSGALQRLSLVFIGGEPMLERRTLCKTIEYAHQAAAKTE